MDCTIDHHLKDANIFLSILSIQSISVLNLTLLMILCFSSKLDLMNL